MRSKAWLAARMSLQLARLPCTASSAQHSRRLRSTLVAAPVLFVHLVVTIAKNCRSTRMVVSACSMRWQVCTLLSWRPLACLK